MIIDYKDLQEKLNVLEIKKAPKTFLQILDKSYNEVLVSKYLSYFLDERNTTREILKQILTLTSWNESVDFVDLLENGIFENIQTEEQISQENRLDIIIKYSNFWLVIENKIWAYESKDNQTLDYENQIKSLNTSKVPVKFIYLKPGFNKSKPSNTNFIELLYEDLLGILKKVKESDLVDKENYLYLQDFVKHTEEFFMKDNQFIVDEQALKFYFENKNKLDYIIGAYKKQSHNIRQLIVDSISNEFSNFKVHDTTSYIQVFKNNWENRGSTGIHFEILPNTNWDSLLGNKPIKLRFAIHNERNTKDKYLDIPHQSLYSKEFMFDNNENIQKSIQGIVEEVRVLISRFEKEIDIKISQKLPKA